MLDLQSFLFWTLACLTGLCAIAVVVTQNIVRSAAWLLFTLGGTAGIFFLIGADFVGATQLVVYVGGTLVLVVFGVMLTAQGPFISMKTGAAEWAIATLVGLLLFGILAVSVVNAPWPSHPKDDRMADATTATTTARLGASFLGLEQATPASNLTGVDDKTAPPRKQTSYLLPFEIVSVHLLVVLIGAAYLARAKRRREVNP